MTTAIGRAARAAGRPVGKRDRRSRTGGGDAGAPLALVTGADHPTGLGSGRALYRAGARVWGLTRKPAAPASRSRVWQKLCVAAGPISDPLAPLQELGGDGDPPAFLLPTQDELVSAISARREELGRSYRFVLPDDEIVQTFLDKTRFYAWAEPLGLPLPASRIVVTDTELRAVLEDMPYPLIVKPLYRTAAWSGASPVQKVLRFGSADDLGRVPFHLFDVADAFIVSQWIAGPDDAVHYCLAYCDAPGSIAASYTGRKLLQYPRQTGSTAVCVGVDNGEVRELTEEVFRQAGFAGLGSLEVKYGPDGRPYITEPTVGRPNLQSYSAVAAGCNLHALAMADALGLDRDAYVARPRNSWWIEEGAVREILLAPTADPVPWRLLARELIRARRASGAYWAWRDPRPFAALLRETGLRMFRYLFRRRPR